MTSRTVTELDFRIPELRDAKVEDYEFRGDGKLVRKDRWERALVSIRFLVGVSGREFEIPDIVEAVRVMAGQFEGWTPTYPGHNDTEELPSATDVLEIRLEDGSTLHNARYLAKFGTWVWNETAPPFPVVAWREQQKPAPTLS